jgi:hypothetical protein
VKRDGLKDKQVTFVLRAVGLESTVLPSLLPLMSGRSAPSYVTIALGFGLFRQALLSAPPLSVEGERNEMESRKAESQSTVGHESKSV